MMKDILCNTKWWGLYHNIMIRSSRSQATRGKQKNASKALWHFEVAELQSKWEAEMRKPPVLEGLWGLYPGKFCSRVETLLLYELGKMGASNKQSQQEDMVPQAFFKRACHGREAWMTGVYYQYQPPRLCRTVEWSTTKLRNMTPHIPPRSSSPCCRSFSN